MKLQFNQLDLKAILEAGKSIDRRILIQGGVILFFSLLFIFGFFMPILMQNKKSVGQVKQLQLMIQGAKTRIARIPEMKQQKEMYGARLEEVRKQFFDPQDIDQIIKVISTTATQAGVRISSSRPSSRAVEFPAPFNQMYMAASYELTLEGPYHRLGTWLNSLERYPKSFGVHDLALEKSEAAPAALRGTVVLTAFFRRTKA